MKKTINTIALSTLLATGTLFGGGDIVPAEEVIIPIPAHIDPNPFYLGLGILWTGTSSDCICLTPTGEVHDRARAEDSSWGGIIRAGYDFNQYFGIEARALTTNLSSDFYDVEHYGIFLKPMMPIGDRMNVYGLIGYGHTEIDADCGTFHETFEHDGFSYGIGLEYDLSSRDADKEEGEYDRPFDGHGDQEKGWGLFVDYQNLMDDEGPRNYRANIVSFGVTYDF
ncbi:MAG: porin family protein [Sulfurovum sp.]|nr:porin family protein [Sulfurovum sp.]